MLKLILVLVPVALAGAQTDQPEPPQIRYGPSRESTGWVAMPGGTQVAVDRGIQWQGVTLYLSLTDDLVAVDSTTGETLWGRSVGAFWKTLGIVALEGEEEGEDDEPRWVVELRPAAGSHPGEFLRQLHDLRTGEQLEDPALPPPPAGTPFEPRLTGHGSQCTVGEARAQLLDTPEAYARVRKELLGSREPSDLPEADDVDFGQEVVLVLCGGETWNSRGLRFVEGYMDDTRVLIRVRHQSYQTMGGGDRVRPFGVYVLPKRELPYVIERNVQGLIGGPPLWKEIHRLDGPPTRQM
jgi:hypothetical protein